MRTSCDRIIYGSTDAKMRGLRAMPIFGSPQWRLLTIGGVESRELYYCVPFFLAISSCKWSPNLNHWSPFSIWTERARQFTCLLPAEQVPYIFSVDKMITVPLALYKFSEIFIKWMQIRMFKKMSKCFISIRTWNFSHEWSNFKINAVCVFAWQF